MSSVNRTSRNDTIRDRLSHVTVTDPQHPLFGNRFAVLGERSGRGSAFVVVELADGRRRSIRVACTDLAEATVRPLSPPPEVGRISVRTLIPLMQHLRANLLLPVEEVIRDGRSSACASRCVSVPSVAAGMRRPPPGGKTAAPLAGPAGGEATADRPSDRRADVADASDPPRFRKGDGPC
jgi:hypothetical protein